MRAPLSIHGEAEADPEAETLSALWAASVGGRDPLTRTAAVSPSFNSC